MPLLQRLLLGQANGTDRWLAEHRRWNILVVHRTVLLGLKQTPDHRHAFGQGHGRQLYTTDHIANRQN
ncbi:hypothetical protein D3C71_1871840 [compost metagenome]